MDLSKDQAAFLSALEKLGNKTGQISLKRALRWSKIRFENVKKELIQSEIISLGKGRGGSVELKGQTFPKNLDFEEEFQISPDELLTNNKLLFPIPEVGTWEFDALNSLEASLSAKQLITLIGAEFFNLLVSKLRSIGQQRKPNKTELIVGLLQIYNRDLLFNPEIAKEMRESLAKSNNVPCPKRLTAGKREALEFVKSVGLPLEFAGEPKEDDRDPFIIIKAKENIYKPLQPFQAEIVSKALKIFQGNKSLNCGLVSLPTGAGKTRTASEIVHKWMDQTLEVGELEDCNLTIWIAQTDELCEQAFNQFREVWENNPQKHSTKIMRMWGGFWTDSKDIIWETIEEVRMPVIAICTINTLHALIIKPTQIIDKALSQTIKEQCDFIVVDEAHHAAAPTYQKVFEEIINHRHSLLEHGEQLGLNLLGLTATPYRGTKDSGVEDLRKIFKNILIPKDSFPLSDDLNPIKSLKKFLQEQEILASEEISLISTNLKIKLDHKGSFDDDYAKKLNDSTNRHKRREFIVEHIKETINENPDSLIIYFGPSVEDAKIISSMLKMDGVRASFIGDKMNLSVREDIISEFKVGKIQVVCNCRILTAGFDAPRITHVYIGWPTDSTVLFHQIIGRGLRGTKFGGTSKCKINIFTDEVEDAKDHEFAHMKYFKEWG